MSAKYASFLVSTVMGQTAQDLVFQHVQDSANATFREPSGVLKFKYVVPAGPYEELWDWDSMFTGLALLEFGSAPYLEGSMLNFLDHTAADGSVGGCLKPKGDTGYISQAKPIVIQGSWLAAKHTRGHDRFRTYRQQMKAQLQFWSRPPRMVSVNGSDLRVWFDQMESGQDNLVTSTCPSWMSRFSTAPLFECLFSWNAKVHELVLSSPDLMTFLHREFTAYALFNEHWAASETDPAVVAELQADAAAARQEADAVRKAMDEVMWDAQLGFHVAYNTSVLGPHAVTNRVSQMAMPMWAGIASREQAESIREQLFAPDMFTPYGIRSASSADPRYTNAKVIVPYSNWRGPVWVLHNVFASYGLQRYGFDDDAKKLADRMVDTLADDLKTGGWHECYHAENGKGLAAPNFLSWNTLAATWHQYLRNKENPFELVDALLV